MRSSRQMKPASNVFFAPPAAHYRFVTQRLPFATHEPSYYHLVETASRWMMLPVNVEGALWTELSSGEHELLTKIRQLPEKKAQELADSVDRMLADAEFERAVDEAYKLSTASLKAVWDNPEDAIYNNEA